MALFKTEFSGSVHRVFQGYILEYFSEMFVPIRGIEKDSRSVFFYVVQLEDRFVQTARGKKSNGI